VVGLEKNLYIKPFRGDTQMKHICLPLITASLFFVAVAVAQNSPSGTNAQGTTGSSPAMNGQAGADRNPGMANPGVDQSGSQPGMSGTQTGDNSGMKSEKKMKGCIQSQGGQYVLETKKGKAVPLSGQDVSAHLGHQVAVHGTWGGSSSDSMSSASAGGGSSSEKTFNVGSVDMISDSCGNDKK
jgi:hypothetical protein